MQMWSLVACGRVADGAQDELAARLAELLAAPAFGCDHSSLVIGPGPSVSALHIPAGRVPEPAVA
jgi:hypothetical protein